jgi:hypothetical protein
MSKCLGDNSMTNRLFRVILQVIFIFIFLTIFFFTYVQTVEKDSFKLQMNIVVDDLLDDMVIRKLVPSGQEEIATILLDGSVEVVRSNFSKNTKTEDDKINKRNYEIKSKAFKWVGVSIFILIIIVSIFTFCGHCIPFRLHLKESILIVLFVAITEIIFLNVITKNYWSVDPSQVRHQIGESIKKWVKKNHP